MMTQTVHLITAALTPTVHLPLSFMSHSTTFHIPTCPPILPPAAHLPMYPLLTSLSAWPHCLLHSALPRSPIHGTTRWAPRLSWAV